MDDKAREMEATAAKCEQTLSLMRTACQAMAHAIRNEVPEDPFDVEDEALRNRLGQVIATLHVTSAALEMHPVALFQHLLATFVENGVEVPGVGFMEVGGEGRISMGGIGANELVDFDPVTAAEELLTSEGGEA